MHPQERVYDRGVIHGASTVSEDLEGFPIGQPRSVRAIRRERIKAIND